MRNIDFTDSVTAAIQGDEAAFEFLYNQTYSYLRITITKYLKKEDEIEDVLQNTYLKIYSELPNLKEPKTFWKWASTIATNAALTEIRRQKALKNSMIDLMPPTKGSFEKEDKTAAVEALDEIAAETYYAEFNPEASMDVKETKRLLDEILADLPESQHQCILLWQEERSMKEIAEQLDMNINTVKTNISLAKKKIKANVLELEKKGTKLYGMAPLPFFLWVFRLFDTSYADTLPIQGDTTLYARITSHISATVSSAGEITQTDTLAAQNTDSSQTSKVPTPAESESAVQNKSAANGSSTITETPLSSTATSTAAKAGATVIKAGIHSLSVKIIVAIICVGVVGIAGILGYQLIKKQLFSKNTEELSQQNTISSSSSSQELSKHLQLDYIGNQLYIDDKEFEAPTGCIGAYAYDLDADDVLEIVSIENHDSEFQFRPEICVYESENSTWNKSVSQKIEFDVLGDYNKDFYSCYRKIYLRDNSIIMQKGDYLDYIEYQYTQNKLHSVNNNLTRGDLYVNGIELCSIRIQYMNSNYTLTEAWIDSYQENYAINFIDFQQLESFENNDFAFEYPSYFKENAHLKTTSYGVAINSLMPAPYPMDEKNGIPIWSIAKSEYDVDTIDMDTLNEQGFPDYTRTPLKILWNDDNTCIVLSVGGDKAAVISDASIQNKDIKQANIGFMIIEDGNEIAYHFTSKLEDGTSYPIIETENIENPSTRTENTSENVTAGEKYKDIYSSVIETISNGIINNWSIETWEKKGFFSEHSMNVWETYHRPEKEYYGTANVGEAITMQAEGSSLQELIKQYTYAYMDIDKNGTTELIFTDKRRENDNDGIFLAALYTIENNEPKLLLTSRVGNAYYLHNNAIISHELGGSGPIASWHYYQFSNNNFIAKANILADGLSIYDPNTKVSYFYSEKELAPGKLEVKEYYDPISEEKANEIMDSYSGFSASKISFEPVVNIADFISEEEPESSSDIENNNTTDYILPDSSTAYLDEDTVKHLSTKELYIARNEIFARHGRQFKDPELKSYFESKSWYSGTISPEEFDKTMLGSLNEYELHNIELIKKYE